MNVVTGRIETGLRDPLNRKGRQSTFRPGCFAWAEVVLAKSQNLEPKPTHCGRTELYIRSLTLMATLQAVLITADRSL